MAVKNIEQFTNPYGEPSAPSGLFDDLYHFQNLHTKRYLDAHKKDQFDTQKEAIAVLEAITTAWNDHIAPLGDKVDRMSPAEKSVLFSSTAVSFDAVLKIRQPMSEEKRREGKGGGRGEEGKGVPLGTKQIELRYLVLLSILNCAGRATGGGGEGGKGEGKSVYCRTDY